MRLVVSICLAYGLDLVFGDPAWIPHPVVLMGKCINCLEAFLRKRLSGTKQREIIDTTKSPKAHGKRFSKTEEGELVAGRILAVVLPVGTFAFTAGLLYALCRAHWAAAFALNTFWCWQALAVRGMLVESRNVAREVALAESRNAAGEVALVESRNTAREVALAESMEDLNWDSARKAVGRIVGRDTEKLDMAGILRATVETVAENFSDGVFAPLFYMAIGGAPLALVYKAVNTMDSMVGYKNERYLYFGRAAAMLDDAANSIPSRLAALVMIGSAHVCEGRAAGKRAARVWGRDRMKHPSPNSAQTEAVMAGALGVRLLGPTWYFGKLYEKEWIGDDVREIETEDIERANRIFLVSSVISLVLLVGCRALVWMMV
ncbi:MAG: adenosylcobinamide-phosphate synthase CbiB [Lachnospiraceae bacterium]|nr:adenosylcobinamide-phosphate synthase CbiB [Lachnospiraceae bacterium]